MQQLELDVKVEQVFERGWYLVHRPHEDQHEVHARFFQDNQWFSFDIDLNFYMAWGEFADKWVPIKKLVVQDLP